MRSRAERSTERPRRNADREFPSHDSMVSGSLSGSGMVLSETSGFEEQRMKPEHRRLFRNNFERAKRTTISVEVSPVSTKVRVASPLQDGVVSFEYRLALCAKFLLPGAISHPMVDALLEATRDAQVDFMDTINTVYTKRCRLYIPPFIRAFPML